MCLTAPALAQSLNESRNPDLTTCEKATAEVRIDACTRAFDFERHETAQRQAMILTLRGSAWHAKGETDRSHKDFTQALELSSQFIPAYEGRANLLRDQGKCDLAISDYSEIMRIRPDRPIAYFGRGICLIDKGQIERAIADLDQVIKLDANNAGGHAGLAWGMKARINSSRGEFDAAIAGLSEALKLNSKHAAFYVERGAAWSSKGDVAKAMADFQQAIQLDTTNSAGVAVVAWSAIAQLHTRENQLDAAITDYGEAIRLDPARPALYINRASVWSRRGDDARALEDYNNAIKMDPNDAMGHIARGDFYRGKGDYEVAIADYNNAIEKERDDLTAYGNRGLARFYQGQHEKAADDFKRVAETHASAYTMLLLYASRARIRGRWDEARDELSKHAVRLQASEWPYPIVQLFLGQRSLEELIGAAATSEQKCEAQFYIGQWQLTRANRDLAARALQVASEICPPEFLAHRGAVEELKRLAGHQPARSVP